jgi:hypothetical protein
VSPGGAQTGRKRPGSTSRYFGVSWNKARSAWRADLWDPHTKRMQHIGYYASEEDAARAYDCAAVQANILGAKRNFPGEAVSELPETMGEQQKQHSSSRYLGVRCDKASSTWRADLWDPQTKRSRRIGCYASEEDAARAYDFAAVQARGPDAKRNFPDEAITELPMTVGL